MTTPNLSALIAEHCMGWQRATVNGKPAWFDGDDVSHSSWDPEHSISDAFEALEAWRGQKEARVWMIQSADCVDERFVVWVGEREDVLDGMGNGDKSLPRAICLALLAAHDIEVPK